MLKESAVIGHFSYLASKEKSRKEKIKTVATELSDLWKKLRFPRVSVKSLYSNIEDYGYMKDLLRNLVSYYIL